MAAPAGNNTVVEAPTAGNEVAKIKANHVVSSDLSTGTVTVKVKGGSTPATETLVTYFNEPLPAIGLKVCKIAANQSLVGDLFSFTENGGSAYSVQAGTAAAPICGPVHSYPLNTNVNVAELATPNVHVSGITVSDNRGSNANLAAGTVTATIGAGVTVVTYTNDVNPIGQTGFIEVCKAAGDSYVNGSSFNFTITGPLGFTVTQPILVGQCTSPIEVPIGNVTVSEANQFPYFLSEVDVVPSNRWVSQNLANGTATVTVIKGDSSTETLVTFVNSTNTGLVKVCKTLTANSVGLAGKTFSFTVTDINGSHTDSVVAGAAGTTACIIDSTLEPLGSHVSITETATPNVQVTGVSVSPASQDLGSFAPTANLTVGSGITTATFTNMALGTVEICKDAADPSTATQSFQFSVNSGAPITVHAGQCSLPIAVPAGTATVSEVVNANFHLVSVLAVGPANDNRVVSGTNPVTVSTPFGGVENETVVTFSNAVNTGSFKICKVSSEPTLQGVPFTFNYTFTVNGVTTTGSVTQVPGTCSAVIGVIPVVDPDGKGIPVKVTEQSTPTVAVSSIVVANGTTTSSSLADGTVCFTVNQGVTTVTYTNVRTPIAA